MKRNSPPLDWPSFSLSGNNDTCIPPRVQSISQGGTSRRGSVSRDVKRPSQGLNMSTGEQRQQDLLGPSSSGTKSSKGKDSCPGTGHSALLNNTVPIFQLLRKREEKWKKKILVTVSRGGWLTKKGKCYKKHVVIELACVCFFMIFFFMGIIYSL